MQLSPDTVLKVVRPLCGIPESGFHWYLTYKYHHLDYLSMFRATIDQCVLICREEGKLSGFVILQVHDSMDIGTNDFLHFEEEASDRYNCKPRKLLTSTPTIFNGSHIRRGGCPTNPSLCTNARRSTTSIHQKALASQRAIAQYIGVNRRPYVTANVQLIEPKNDPVTPSECEILAKTILHLKKKSDTGLNYRPIDLN